MAGSDYSSLDNAQIIIPAGSIVNTEVCINVSIVDDDDFEQDEMLTVEWTPDPYGLLIFIATTMTTVTITDNDGRSLQMDITSSVICLLHLLVVATISVPSEVNVSEGDGTVEVCATLSGVSASDLPISIMLITTPGIL